MVVYSPLSIADVFAHDTLFNTLRNQGVQLQARFSDELFQSVKKRE